MDRETDEAPALNDAHDHHDNGAGIESDGGDHAASSVASPVKLAQVVTTDEPPAGTDTPPANQTTPQSGTPQQPTSTAAAGDAAVSATFVSTEGAKIVLPVGANVDTITVRGDDILLVQKDGSVIVIVDGVQHPPVLVIGGIEIPADTLAQIISNAEQGVPTAGAEVPEPNGVNVPQENAPVTATFTSSDGAKIVLPAGTSIDTVMVRGDDLILVQEDGSIVVILDGAKFPPTLVLGGIEIPHNSLAAIISGVPEGVPAAGPSTTQAVPEAGPQQVPSSGADFSVVNPGIGDAFPIGDLLPPTALQFFVPEVREEEVGFLEEQSLGIAQAAQVPAPAAPAVLAVEPGPEGPPDLVQVPGSAVGVVEEEHLRFGVAESPGQLSEGNEDVTGNPLNSDMLGQPDNTSNFVGGSLASLSSGGVGTLHFTLVDPGNVPVLDTDGQALKSQGDPVLYHWIDANHLIGYADDGSGGFDGAINDDPDSNSPFHLGSGPDRIVYTLTLNDDGSFLYELVDQVDHFPGVGENLLGLDFTALILITDDNGSTLSLTGEVFTIQIIDDVPLTVSPSEPESLALDEDDLDNFDSIQADNIEGSTGTDTTGPKSVTLDLDAFLGGAVKIGSDEFQDTDDADQFSQHATFSLLAPDISNGITAIDSAGGTQTLFSKGTMVNGVAFDGPNKLVFTADGRIVATLEINPATSIITYTLIDQLDHPFTDSDFNNDDNPLKAFADQLTFDLSAFIQVQDFDQDPVPLAPSTVNITITDDIPVFVQEPTDASGSVGTASTLGLTGTFDITIGADEDGTYDVRPVGQQPDGIRLYDVYRLRYRRDHAHGDAERPAVLHADRRSHPQVIQFSPGRFAADDELDRDGRNRFGLGRSAGRDHY